MTNMFSSSFSYIDPPEASMPWENYERIVLKEWEDLRSIVDAPESEYQNFLERHPCMLPIGRVAFPGSNKDMFPSAVISQPPLSGLIHRIPDFMTFSRDSAAIHVNMIEIERPDKIWFTAQGQPTADFTQALDQLREWKEWIADPVNLQSFTRDYKFSTPYSNYKGYQFHYTLVYGNSSGRTEEFRDKRKYLPNGDETLMTFDRLSPDRSIKDLLTVKLDQNGYRCINVPPTLRLGPQNCRYFPIISGKTEAVDKNSYISNLRKQFLKSRLPYWDAVCKNGGPFGVIAFSETGE